MRRNDISVIPLLAICLFLFISIVPKANAEYVFNLPWKDVEDETKKASVNISSGISNLLKSLEMLEKGRIAVANHHLNLTRNSLSAARTTYRSVEAKIKPGKVDISRVPPQLQGFLVRDFSIYKLIVPNSREEVAKLARQEIEEFAALLRRLEDYTAHPQSNRQNIRTIIDNLRRFMLMGIDVSELAASNP